MKKRIKAAQLKDVTGTGYKTKTVKKGLKKAGKLAKRVVKSDRTKAAGHVAAAAVGSFLTNFSEEFVKASLSTPQAPTAQK